MLDRYHSMKLLVLVFLSLSLVANAETSVAVKWDSQLGPIRPGYFGHNTNWARGGLGIWDDTTHTYNEALIQKIQALKPGLLRFPGGTRAMRFRFEETIGPYALRKPQCDVFSASFDPTTYGLDEFLRLAERLGSEVSLVAPWAIGSPERTAAMVAYVNGTPDSNLPLGVDIYGEDWKTAGYWAELRGQNGHPAPYGVKYVEIGNEEYYSLPVGFKKSCDWPIRFQENFRYVNGERILTTATDHATQVSLTGKLVRKVDPNILIGASVGSKYPEESDINTYRAPVDERFFNPTPWTPTLSNLAGSDFDFFMLHRYPFGTRLATPALADTLKTGIEALHQLDPNKMVGITEYELWTGGSTMLDALYSADVMRVAISEQTLMSVRHDLNEDDETQFFKKSGAIQGDGSVTTPYLVMQLLASEFGGMAVETTTDSLNVSAQAAVGPDGSISVLLINRSSSDDAQTISLDLPQRDWTGTFDGIQATSLDATTSQSFSSKVGNPSGGTISLTLPAHSVGVLNLF